MSVSSAQGVEMPARRLADLLGAGEAQIVDIREPHEYEAGHVAGSRHIEFDEVHGASDSFDRGTALVFACRGGNRSAMVAEAFRTGGYDAYHVEGGLLAWAEEGLPLEPETGEIVER